MTRMFLVLQPVHDLSIIDVHPATPRMATDRARDAQASGIYYTCLIHEIVANLIRTVNNCMRTAAIAANTYTGTPMIVYILQVSDKPPTQFRITVGNFEPDTAVTMVAPGFTQVGVYATPEELTAALAPYLHMEEGK